jgi:hypothetical protein
MKKKLTIDISPALHQQIEAYAKSRETSVSATVRLALIDFAEKLNLPAPNNVSETTERPRKLSSAEMEAAWKEEDAKARESWLREGY